MTDLYRDNPPGQHCLVLVVGFGSGPFSQISSSEVMSLSNNDDSRDDLIIGGIFDKDWQEKMACGMFMYYPGGGKLWQPRLPLQDPLYARHAKSVLGSIALG